MNVNDLFLEWKKLSNSDKDIFMGLVFDWIGNAEGELLENQSPKDIQANILKQIHENEQIFSFQGMYKFSYDEVTFLAKVLKTNSPEKEQVSINTKQFYMRERMFNGKSCIVDPDSIYFSYKEQDGKLIVDNMLYLNKKESKELKDYPETFCRAFQLVINNKIKL